MPYIGKPQSADAFRVTPSNIDSALKSGISGSNDSEMTLATASIAAITSSISELRTHETLSTASIAAITASISRLDNTESNMTLATASIAAITASLGQPVNTDSNVTFNNINSTGTITAVEVHTTFVSSSIAVASGSNNFGDATDDHHSFTGSLSVSGSGTITGSLTVNGDLVLKDNADFNGDISGSATSTGSFGRVEAAGTVNVGAVADEGDAIITNGADGGRYDVLTVQENGNARWNLSFEGAGAANTLTLNSNSTSNVLVLDNATGNTTFAGNQNLTGDLTIGAHANGNTTGHANLNLAADANEGADSYLNFTSGTTARGSISYDHNQTAADQTLSFNVGDDAVNAIQIKGNGHVILTQNPAFLGVGADVASNWGSSFDVIGVGHSAAVFCEPADAADRGFHMSNNIVHDGAGTHTIYEDQASAISQKAGVISFKTTGSVAPALNLDTIGGTERMRVSHAGCVSIGLTSAGDVGNAPGLCVLGTQSSVKAQFIDNDGSVDGNNVIGQFKFANVSDASNGHFIEFADSAGIVGEITANGGSNTAYTTSSDRRLKTNIKDISNQLDKINKIKVREYTWLKNDAPGIGMIAQELEKIIPEVVIVGGDDEKKRPYSIDYGRLTPWLIKAVQELSAKIDSQQKEIEELKS